VSRAGQADDSNTPPMKRSRRKMILIAAALLALLVPAGLLVVANVVVARAAAPYTRPLAELPPCQVAIVLGAGVRADGTPSAVLEDRLRTGLELYQSGRVRKLLLSGDHGRITYDEANAMRRYALAAGLPRQDVFLDHAGFRTYDTMYRARDVFLVRDAIIVTQRFHLARAVYTARGLGLQAWGCAADRRRYATARRNTVREWLARAKAVLDLHLLRTRPRYLGPEIPITGDGRATWDETD